MNHDYMTRGFKNVVEEIKRGVLPRNKEIADLTRRVTSLETELEYRKKHISKRIYVCKVARRKALK